MLVSGGLAGLAGMIEVAGPIGQLTTGISPGYGFTAIIVAFLGRLNPIGGSSPGCCSRSPISAATRRRSTSACPSPSPAVPGHAAVLLLACDILIIYRIRLPARASAKARGAHAVCFLTIFLVSVIAASTPLLLAATGELVAERSGVLNLGVEGMMLVGAVCGLSPATTPAAPRSASLAATLRRRRHGRDLRHAHADLARSIRSRPASR